MKKLRRKQKVIKYEQTIFLGFLKKYGTGTDCTKL